MMPSGDVRANNSGGQSIIRRMMMMMRQQVTQSLASLHGLSFSR